MCASLFTSTAATPINMSWARSLGTAPERHDHTEVSCTPTTAVGHSSRAVCQSFPAPVKSEVASAGVALGSRQGHVHQDSIQGSIMNPCLSTPCKPARSKAP